MKSALLLFGLVAYPALAAAGAENYPAKPIRIIVPQQAGGSVDITARYLVAQLQVQLNQSIIVDNRPGATGIIGTQVAAKATPDGYTLLYNASNMLIDQLVNPKHAIDVLSTFAPISLAVASRGNLVVVNPALRARSVQELIALARSNDRPLKYGSQGVGSGQQLLVETFNLRAGTRLVHVPYKGVPAIITAAINGEVDVLFINPIAVVPHIKAGRLRAIGYTGSARWPVMQEIPTVSESGLPGFDNPQASWHGLFAPLKTPREITMKIYTEVNKALQVDKVRGALEGGSYFVDGNKSPDAFRKYIESDLKRIKEVVDAAKITADS